MLKNLSIRSKIIIIGVTRALIASVVIAIVLSIFTDLSDALITAIALVLLALMLIGEMLVIWGTQVAINRALMPIILFSHSVAEGDLSSFLEQRYSDAIGNLITAQNAMVDGLRMIIDKLREASNTVTATTEELAAASQQVMASAEEVSATVDEISRGAEAQARAVEEASEIVVEIAGMASSVADQAKASADTALKANDIARSGSQNAAEAAERLSEMQHAMDSVTDIMQNLGDRSMQIGLVVDVITNISEQTNMLALNAAIEASRAGEHGRGFAVVAEEVRSLAEGSRKAAEQISRMIHDTENETRRALAALEQSKDVISASIEVVRSTFGALTNVVDIVADIAGSSESVYTATEAQRDGSERVVRSAHDIAAIAEEAAAGTEQASAAAAEQAASVQEIRGSIQELAHFAIEMKSLVDDFKLGTEA